MDKYVIAPPSGSSNNSVGAEDRPWKEGHFEKLVADDVVAGKVTADEVDNKDKVRFLFPKNTLFTSRSDCEIIVTQDKNIMIDTGVPAEKDYILGYMRNKSISKIDYILLTHYHGDHYGGLAGFLAEPEFANVKVFVPPDHDISGFTSQSYQDVTTVLTILNNAGVDYQILNADMTLTLAKNCTIKFMCTDNNFLTYMDSHNPVNYNDYSVYALVEHGDVKALFTGDGWGAETDYVFSYYDLPKVNLLKAIHHGESSNITTNAYAFYRQLSPDYCIFNQSYGYADAITDYEFEIINSLGGEVLRTTDDVEFISDGDGLFNISRNIDKTFSADVKATDLYVDINATENPDGTQQKPYKYLMDALRAVNPNSNSRVIVHVADGNYGNLIIRERNDLRIVGDNLTFGEIQLYNCANIRFNVNKLTCTRIYADSAHGVRISGTKAVINSADTVIALHLYDSDMIFTNTLEVYGKTTGKTGDGIEVNNSTLHIWTAKLYNLNNAIKLGYASIFTCVWMNCNNIALMINNAGADPLVVAINNYATMTNIDNKFETVNAIRIVKLKTPETITSRGTTTDRPQGLMYGQLYFDSGIGHLLIFNGVNWFDSTTGLNV